MSIRHRVVSMVHDPDTHHLTALVHVHAPGSETVQVTIPCKKRDGTCWVCEWVDELNKPISISSR